MSSVSYCRVKWTIQAGDLERDEIQQWTGNSRTEAIIVEMPLETDNIITNWSLAITASAEYFYFTLEGNDNVAGLKNWVFIKSDDEPDDGHVNENNVEYLPRMNGMKIRKETFAEILTRSPQKECKLSVLFTVQMTPEGEIRSLKSFCGEALNSSINADNVLEMFNIAAIFEAKEMEAKCLALILFYYKELKETQSWKNLRQKAKDKIIELFYDLMTNTNLETREVTLDDEEEFPDEQEREEIADLIYELDFHSEDEIDDFGGFDDFDDDEEEVDVDEW